MKRFVFGLILFFLIAFSHKTLAANSLGNIDTQVKAQVQGQPGQYLLGAFGYVSPFASIVMTTDNTFLKSTTADSKGYFSMQGVVIKTGLSNLCFDAIDFKKIGESKSCLTFPNEKSSVTKKDIFLPPTIGLARKQVNESSSASIFGYSMPNAKVKVNVSNGQVLGVQTDTSGYYQVTLASVKRGRYLLYATANLNNVNSLDPTSRVELEAISVAAQVGKTFTSISIIVWIIVLLFILIIILLLILLWRRRKKHAEDKKQQNYSNYPQQN